MHKTSSGRTDEMCFQFEIVFKELQYTCLVNVSRPAVVAPRTGFTVYVKFHDHDNLSLGTHIILTTLIM